MAQKLWRVVRPFFLHKYTYIYISTHIYLRCGRAWSWAPATPSARSTTRARAATATWRALLSNIGDHKPKSNLKDPKIMSQIQCKHPPDPRPGAGGNCNVASITIHRIYFVLHYMYNPYIGGFKPKSSSRDQTPKIRARTQIL